MTKPTKACLFANYLQSQFANRNALLQNTNLHFPKIYFTFAFSKLQNQTLKMDISSRLKEFLDYTGMQSTQFADSCGIPRPSFSQLLRGRNKKVSDEVITKIHESFPQLSILWLMFGEGDMVTSSNIEISEPENGLSDDDFNSSSDNYEPLGIFGLLDNNTNIDESIPRQTNTLPGISDCTQSEPTNQSVQSKQDAGNTASGRTIRSIIVFYSDNSFETFAKS